jgi:hypothetical protein
MLGILSQDETFHAFGTQYLVWFVAVMLEIMPSICI